MDQRLEEKEAISTSRTRKESDWRAIQETLYLLNIPGMREPIREGLDLPIEDYDEEIDL